MFCTDIGGREGEQNWDLSIKQTKPDQQWWKSHFHHNRFVWFRFFSHVYEMPIKQSLGSFLIWDLLLHLQRTGSRLEQLLRTRNN